ncbi:arylesterase [Motiliproteus sp. MSK22-1]|nr:arylesterase [Motiliproteus sp. MSK22-1]
MPVRATAMELLVLGDSISAGYGLEDKSGWVQLLEQRLKRQHASINVINASISGETTSGGLTRLPTLLERYQPRWVIIELGGNDGLRGTPLKAMESNIERLITKAQEAGAEVLLLGMRIPPNYGRRYAEGFFQTYARVAQRHQVSYYPFFLEGVGGIPELMQADGIHPNDKAQDQLLDNIWPQLESLLTHTDS